MSVTPITGAASALTGAASTGSGLPVTGLPATAQALEPQSVRDGGKTAQNAYDEGLAFENVLINELAQQLTGTVSGLGGASDGLGGSSGGSLASGATLGAYSSLLPQALTEGLMSSGGTGIAMQIARALDPALTHPPAASGAGQSASGQPFAASTAAQSPTAQS